MSVPAKGRLFQAVEGFVRFEDNVWIVALGFVTLRDLNIWNFLWYAVEKISHSIHVIYFTVFSGADSEDGSKCCKSTSQRVCIIVVDAQPLNKSLSAEA